MKRSFLFAACMLLATSTLLAQAKFDVIHYGLAMSFDFKKGKLYLEELITLERLDNGKQIALDLITKDNDGYGMEVISPNNSMVKPFSNFDATNNKDEMY